MLKTSYQTFSHKQFETSSLTGVTSCFNLLNGFHHYVNKTASAKPLSFNCIASFFSTTYLLKSCSVYRGYWVNYSFKQFEFSFCSNFLRNVKKIEMLFPLLFAPPSASGHQRYRRPRAQISHTDLQTGEWYYIYWIRFSHDIKLNLIQ